MKDITVAIVGRPNVGKSTLFNIMIGKNRAITHGQPGVTIDRQYGTSIQNDIRYIFIDTGGYDENPNELIEKIREQSLFAITESDIAIFVVDGKVGLMPSDEEIAQIIRNHNKPVILAINKIDNEGKSGYNYEFYKLGMKTMITISAAHKKNIDLLKTKLHEIADAFDKEEAFKKNENDDMSIAIVGLPNAGKSSMINFFLGKDRMVVSDIPGTTRDSVDTSVEFHGLKLNLIDTAGIRKKSKIANKLETFSILRTIKSIERADIVILIIDSQKGITAQDQKISALVKSKKKCLILAYNKVDLLDNLNDFKFSVQEEVRKKINFYPNVGVEFISAKSGYNISKLVDLAFMNFQRYRATVKTSQLNKLIQEIMEAELPGGMRQIKIYYGVQTGTRPPAFKFFINSNRFASKQFMKFLEKKLTNLLDLSGIPVRIKLNERR